jgi:formylglycine-generating enzyme required for sulfatase activity
MSLATSLIAYAVRQVLDVGVENVLQCVEDYLTDGSRALPKALAKANDRSWQALGVALAGDGFLDRVKVFFASGDDKGVREQVSRFLAGNPLGLDGEPAAFRRTCLEELQQLRQAKRLGIEPFDARAVARRAAACQRHADPTGLVQGAVLATTQVADGIREWAPNLARLLRQPTPAGPPLLAAAFCYFFRREVETDDELAHGLFFDGLRQLSASQAKGFGEVRQVLDTLGGRFDEVFEHLDRIESVAVQTRVAVRDLHAEIRQLHSAQSAGVEEMRRLIASVQELRARPGDLWTNALGMRFAWVPAGAFVMGSPPHEKGHHDNEFAHRVVLTKGVFLGVTPVTQAEWRAVMGSNPSRFPGDQRPVEQVSWQDGVEFCRRLRERDGKEYRLPTEAEWEYACRAGTTTPFSCGDTISTDQANYDGSQAYGRGRKGESRRQTTPVGMFPPNAWGLYDMHGNVWEWCQDWFGEYPRGDVTDPPGPSTGAQRVLRGGSWFFIPVCCRAAYRFRNDPTKSFEDVGFRVCVRLE